MEITLRLLLDVTPHMGGLIERLVAALEAVPGRVTAPPAPVLAPISAPVTAMLVPDMQIAEPAMQIAAPDALAAVEPPVPVPAPAERQRRPSLWSPARDAVLVEGWPKGIDVAALHIAVNALSGPVMPRDRLAVRAAYLRLKRPPGYHGQTKSVAAPPVVPASVPVAAPPVPAPAPAAAPVSSPVASPPAPPRQEAGSMTPPVSTTAVEASLDQIRRWAGERGISFDHADDLPRVNAKRRQHFLPPFVVRKIQR